MSRIGRVPIIIPSGVKVNLKEDAIHIEGPLGKLDQSIHPSIKVELQDGRISVKRLGDSGSEKALHGLHQRLISNMVQGVTNGYEKNLEITGVGFKAKAEGKHLVLQLGFSHPIKYPIPDGVKITVSDNVKINVSGADKRLVGEVAAEIRGYYPPEPFKGKGIRYKGEYVRRKAGKTVATKGAAGGGAK